MLAFSLLWRETDKDFKKEREEMKLTSPIDIRKRPLFFWGGLGSITSGGMIQLFLINPESVVGHMIENRIFLEILFLSMGTVGALFMAFFSEHGTSKGWQHPRLKRTGYVLLFLCFLGELTLKLVSWGFHGQ